MQLVGQDAASRDLGRFLLRTGQEEEIKVLSAAAEPAFECVFTVTFNCQTF